MVSDIRDIEYFEGLQREVRAHNHDLYLAYLFFPNDKRQFFLYLAHFYCELEVIRRSDSELMLRLIRVQWWLDQFETLRQGETGGLPIGEYWLKHNLPVVWLETLAQYTMDALDAEAGGEADPALDQNIASPLFAIIADLLGYDANKDLTIDTACGFWCDSMVDDLTSAQSKFSMLKVAMNSKSRAERKKIFPILVLIKLANQRFKAWPKPNNPLGDLMRILLMSLTGRL